ncbi:ArdC family protein [Ensifer sesbaniae]|uniref:ArdC family protein n=1 Tax=Ensifer sesbaniae TaxID=1214071 RepID=UPI00289E8AE3|nr:ArdC-like ssDNA-binding domain-containing protein [Ensifer sesbaniae]
MPDAVRRGRHHLGIRGRIASEFAASLEKGIKPWTQPWNSSHAAGPVSRPLRFNGETYSGINVLTLWASAMERSLPTTAKAQINVPNLARRFVEHLIEIGVANCQSCVWRPGTFAAYFVK